MKIVIDHKIPFIKGVFESVAEVSYLPGGDIANPDICDADCLLIRTRTRCNKSLLEGTRVRFIGTATIGFDHIDVNWCRGNGIEWTNAPGCNSGAVAQYVESALLALAEKNGFQLDKMTLGIIGVGHVGKKVDQAARALGMKTLLNDPPRARIEGPQSFTPLSELLQKSDFVTIHVPLNREGPDRTFHLVDELFLEQIKPGAVMINSSRGEVMNEDSVLSHLRKSKSTYPAAGLGSLVIDVWENEPNINLALMEMADIATPHIAGYSVNGKYNATRMMVEAVSRFFSIHPAPLPPLMATDTSRGKEQGARYDIMSDDKTLRSSPETFEQQRNNYPERWEQGRLLF
jgi:erythronate-4-phosphate dehydrogenase